MLELPLWALVFRLKKLIPKINDFGYRIMKPHLLKPENMITMTSELCALIEVFCSRLGIDSRESKRLAQLLSHTLEYDDAYRTRLQDIITACDERALVNNPREEIKRLLRVYKQREPDQHVARKMQKIVSLLSLLLFIPKIYRAFVSTVLVADFKRLKRDASDEYWVLNRGDYNFIGMTYEERIKLMVPAPQGYLITPD